MYPQLICSSTAWVLTMVEKYRALQVTSQLRNRNRKDLVCSCGFLNRLYSAFIRFGVVVT